MALLVTIFMALSTVLAIVLAAFYLFFKRKFSYWEKRKVPHVKPSIPFGNLRFDVILAESFAQLYKQKSHERFFGFWMAHRPTLMVNDPELIKKILITDFNSFRDHGGYVNVKDDPLNNHLFALNGQEWRNLRAKISPTFSSGKMRNMFPILDEISKNFFRVLDPIAEKGNYFDVKDMIGRYATDVIGNIAFGIETNSLNEPDSIFRKMGKKIFSPTWKNMISTTMIFLVPDLARMLKVVQTDKEVTDFFMNLTRDTMDYRQKNNVTRNDVLQLLIQLMNKGVVEDIDDKEAAGYPFKFEDAAAQAFVFFLGGYETTSSAMQLTLYELAKNQAIQDRLREEIRAEMKKTNGQMTYDAVFNLKYGGMILDESQRVYPQGAILFRQCNKDYPVDGSDLVIEKGVNVMMSIMGLHHDPRYYPNPEVFDPERFTEEEKQKRQSHVYLPFGDGPRFCVGQRFAQMQMRAILFSLVARYKFEFSEKTPHKLEFDPKTIILTPKGGLYLKITKI